MARGVGEREALVVPILDRRDVAGGVHLILHQVGAGDRIRLVTILDQGLPNPSTTEVSSICLLDEDDLLPVPSMEDQVAQPIRLPQVDVVDGGPPLAEGNGLVD